MAVQDGGQSEWGNKVVFVKGVNSPEVQKKAVQGHFDPTEDFIKVADVR